MQVSHDMDTQVSKTEDLHGIAETSRPCITGIGEPEGKQGRGRALDAGSRPYVAFDSAEILGGAGDWVHQSQERHPYRPKLCGETKELYRSALLGQGISDNQLWQYKR